MAADKARSLRALDLVNFFLADIQTGVGPYLAIYLTASRHWDPASVGIAVSAQSIATVMAQAPAGALVDWSNRKPWLIAGGAVAVALGCVGLVLAPTLLLEVITQCIIGIAAAVFSPAIAAVSLGIVGKPKLSQRVGRNEGFNHGGNVTFALVAGLLGTCIAPQWVFYASAVLATGTVLSALMIRDEDIDNEVARAAGEESEQGTQAVELQERKDRPHSAGFKDLLQDRRLPIFTVAVILFHFANAAMLPLVGELLSRDEPNTSALSMSACIIVAQLVMVPVALLTGRFADTWGRKPIFLVGFAVLALRGVLYTFGSRVEYLLAVQSLDGVGAAIFGVLWVVIIADLAEGTGRFNLMQGAVQAALGLGAFLSNFVAGFVVKSMGYNVGFLALASIAALGFAFFASLMPETKDEEQDTEKAAEGSKERGNPAVSWQPNKALL